MSSTEGPPARLKLKRSSGVPGANNRFVSRAHGPTDGARTKAVPMPRRNSALSASSEWRKLSSNDPREYRHGTTPHRDSEAAIEDIVNVRGTGPWRPKGLIHFWEVQAGSKCSWAMHFSPFPRKPNQ